MKKFISILKTIGFYLLSFTWGILLTFVGCIAALGLLITWHKPHLFYQNIYFEVGENWRGISLGIFFFTAKNSTLQEKQHLAGHGIQNIILGVLMPVIIIIPAALRCWLRQFKTYERKRIFAAIFFLTIEAVIMGLCILGFFFNVHLMHVCCCIIVYVLPLFVWFLAQELPQYQRDEDIPYDKALIEKTATQLGMKFYK